MAVTVLALVVAALFAGAAAYINLVEQPARLRLADGPLLAEWKIAYKRGTVMQASLALLGGALGLAAFVLEGGDLVAIVGAASMLASWPWTLLVIKPTNDALMAAPVDVAGAGERRMIQRWASLHLVRTAFGFLAVACFVSRLLTR